MKQYIRGALVAASLALTATAPSAMAIGEWQVYQNYNSYDKMVSAHGLCYVLGTNHVFAADLSDGEEYRFYPLSRMTGLSGSEIVDIAACRDLDMLCIVYTDGNIDLLGADGTITNVPDLRFKNIQGDKSVRGLQVQDTRLFIATGFGFLVLDLQDGTFTHSVQTGQAATIAFEVGDYLYYSNATGTFACPTSAPASAPSSWKKVNSLAIERSDIFDIDGTTQAWFTTADNRLYRFTDDGTFTQFDQETFYRNIFHTDSHLILTGSGIHSIDLRTPQRASNYTGTYTMTNGFGLAGDSALYLLHPSIGLRIARINSYNDNWKFDIEIVSDSIQFSQMGSPRFGNMFYRDGVLTALTGGMESINYDATVRQGGILAHLDTETGTWTSVTQAQIDPQIAGSAHFSGLNALAIDAAHPNRIYAGALNYGVYLIEGDSLVEYLDYTNSPIPQWEGEAMSRCTAIMADSDGSEWFACGGTPYNLTRRSAEGKWTKYALCDGEWMRSPQRIVRAQADPYHLVWVVNNSLYQEGSVGILYDAGTPENTGDDQTAHFTKLTDQDGNSILPNFYYDIAEDKNGTVWILTSSGPFVVDSQVETFNNPGKVRRPKIPRNDGTNLADYLMADVACTCIAIDAANRKWIGTLNNGLYLLSADGLTQLEHFTTENSPLPSNYIMALTVDEESGTLYISAEGGICSYTTDAVSGAKDFKAAYCYPNPVRPDYTGDLHVQGLMDQAKVRICDVANHVLYETTSQGGMISWNLQGADGKRVKSGVYLVYGIDEAGKSGCVCKVLVVD